MKTLLKIIGIIALAAALLAAALLVYVSAMPAAPRRYTRTVETGGALEAEYLAEGERRVRRYEAEAAAPMERFSVWYPEGEDVCPAVVLVNGTGVPASKYKSVFRHLASRGFIAVGNEDPGTWSGETARLTAQFLLEENARPGSLLYGRVDADNLGVCGHSQSGAGALNAASGETPFKTCAALSPTCERSAAALGWTLDVTRVGVPTLLVAGTEGEFETKLVIPPEELESMLSRLPGQKAAIRRAGAEHGQMLYSANGYVLAWLSWQLMGDGHAAGAFTGPDAELARNPKYLS